MNRETRRQSARHWITAYAGIDVIKGYLKSYGVSTVCAIVELRRLGVFVSEERLHQARITEMQKARTRTSRKAEKIVDDFPESDETFAYIAGYTEAGFPYGIRWDEKVPWDADEDGPGGSTERGA